MKVPILLAAGGAAWETEALAVVQASGQLVLVRRCLDLGDLLACASTGSASVAVVGGDVLGLDVDAVATLHRHEIAVVVVHDGPSEVITRLGVDHVVSPLSMSRLGEVLAGAGARHPMPGQLPDSPLRSRPAAPAAGELVAVWGPAGAPGRTTVAVTLAAELAHCGKGVLLLDADPYGGAVAQHLGMLDQVSGLLAAARLGNAGQLDSDRLAAAARTVAPGYRVLTGLPRADRWVEVRATAFDALLETARTLAPCVLVDAGFCLEHDPDAHAGPARNGMTVAALESADRVVVVGAADPVSLTRLVRGLHDLAELLPGQVPLVVVNRMRGTLGWGERDIADTIAAVSPGAQVHFLPEDRPAADRALVAGRSLVESGDSSLRKAVAGLAGALLRDPAEVPANAQLLKSR